MQWRVGATILLITGWLVFILIFAFFTNYSLFQGVVVFIASLIALFGLIAATWATWGMRFAGWDREHWR